MKKKAILASAIALVTASAMAFAPVSYKVIDKTYAAPATSDKAEVSTILQGVFAQLHGDDDLKGAYDALLPVASADVSSFDIADLEALNTKLGADAGAVQTALKALLQQIIVDYPTNSTNLTDLSQDLEDAIADLNTALENHITDPITTDALASLLLDVEGQVFEELDGFIYTGASALIDLVTAQLEAEWDSTSNSLVNAVKELYNDDLDALKDDVENYKTENQAQFDTNKEIYKAGVGAVGIAYLKYKLEGVEPLSASGLVNRKSTIDVDLFGATVPLTAIAWTPSVGTISADSGELVLDLTGVSLPANVKITAAVNNTVGIPTALQGVALFEQTIRFGTSSVGGGDGVVVSDLALVNNYDQKAAAIAGAVTSFLEQNPELYNNTLTHALIKSIEQYVREALLVQAASAVTVNNGVSTLNVTPAQMQNIYDTQLNTVLAAVKAALEAQGLELNINPVLTYNLGVTSNAELKLSQALIDSLKSKGITSVGAKTGDASVEINLSQLGGASTVSIKKSAATVAGAKSDVYSIDVTNAAGESLTAFEKQYRVTLPVSGSGANVTVAKVSNGTLTYVGGQYDAATGTITFYTNELADYVVVENKATFNDIGNIAWANGDIQHLADLGLLNGKGNGVFDPKGNVTRAEFTAMLTRVFNLNASTDLTFNDVSENAWYHDAVAAAKAYGIANGRSASVFDPNASISREEMATMASNALKAVLDYQAPASTEITPTFVDAGLISSAHSEAVAFIANEGIVQGKGNNNFDPKGTATRAESAVVLAKLLNLR